jgi:hypothetical protein
MGRLAVIARQSFGVAEGQAPEHFLEAAVDVGVAVAVQLEHAEEQQQLFKMVWGKPAVHGLQRVGDGTRDGRWLQVADEFKNVGRSFWMPACWA